AGQKRRCQRQGCHSPGGAAQPGAIPILHLRCDLPAFWWMLSYNYNTASPSIATAQGYSTKKRPPHRKARCGGRRWFSCAYADRSQLSKVLDGADHLAGVAVLVVVPGDDLDLVGVVVDLGDHGLGGVEQAAVTHADDVGGNDLLVVVAEALRSGGRHGGVDALLDRKSVG